MYSLLLKKSAEKELRKLPTNIRLAVTKKIQALKKDPYPNGVTKLRGADDLYRMRHTTYRIIYSVDNGELVVWIIKVAHRREVYRDF